MTAPLLDVDRLSTHYQTPTGPVKAVEDNSLTLEEGEVLGVVGESGSGKSTLLRSVMGLVEDPGEIVEGSVEYRGRELTTMSDAELRKLRGNDISFIFQEPTAHLNPAYTVGDQITDVLEAHTDLDSDERWERVYDLLGRLGIPSPRERAEAYPHEFSGGMAQRVCIAMALACDPDLLLADEPTSALDVTIQAQIIDLLSDLQEDLGLSILWVTHDMGVVAETCDTMAVMYAGNVVEYGPVESVFAEPSHPYTEALLRTVPSHLDTEPRFDTIEGSPPDLQNLPDGCVFRERCPDEMEACSARRPPYYELSEERLSKCFLHEGCSTRPSSPSAPDPTALDDVTADGGQLTDPEGER
ncbi:peptide/nickel transport system ATP-binding protein [Haloplanus vescus]|uniref:Nickel import system ATP-binding protein NikD n=1 Tax=Haloplanus vescus TaxID=555874 RepID=A0A1H3WBM5_9EURY|nr:ABC transporter ATP-binding protein [Haloplanus vescus]SDZ84485.1 peptide/nickel transport system ATP-binding protein [Haloplanus vescus]